MSTQALAIQSVGLNVSVGNDMRSACAAIRAKVVAPVRSLFKDAAGDWITVQEVQPHNPRRGTERLLSMLSSAVDECVRGVPRLTSGPIAAIVCLTDSDRPLAAKDLGARCLAWIEDSLGLRLDDRSCVAGCGRTSLAVALERARALLYEHDLARVLVVAVDSLLNGPTLAGYGLQGRLLSASNSNGFIPGEGAAALIVGKPDAGSLAHISGIGVSTEDAGVLSDLPLRGEGLALAFRTALRDAECELHDLHFRVADLSGEQYFFKEAAIAAGRILRRRKEVFELWTPAECVGETGSVAGFVCLIVALAAIRRGYAPGDSALVHLSGDDSTRAAFVVNGRFV